MRAWLGLCRRKTGCKQQSEYKKQERAPKRPSFPAYGHLEPVRHAERNLSDVCTAPRLRRCRRPCPVGVNRRRIVLQLGGDGIEERLLVEIVCDSTADQRTLQARRAAVPDRQLARAFPAAHVLDRRAPRAAPARFKADGPVRMLIAHEPGPRGLAAFFVFQPGDIAGDAVVSKL